MRANGATRTGAVLALGLLAGVAQAQPYDPSAGALTTLRIRIGELTPSGGDGYWREKERDYFGESGDLRDLSVSVDYLRRLGPRFRLLVDLSTYGGQRRPGHRVFRDSFGRPLEHREALDLAHLDAGLVLLLAPAGRRVVPYLGAGAAAVNWVLKEDGLFREALEEGFSRTVFQDDGVALGYFAAVGVHVRLLENWFVLVEGRWRQAEDDLGRDFRRPGPIDLSSTEVSTGVGWHW